MENLTLATMGTRFVAQLLDSLIFGTFTVVVLVVLSGVTYILRGEITETFQMIIGVGYFIFLILTPVMAIAYFAYFDYTPQGTFGKRIMNIRVVNENAETMTLGQSIGRAVMKYISGLICGIGHLIGLFDESNRTLHDMTIRTYVVRTDV